MKNNRFSIDKSNHHTPLAAVYWMSMKITILILTPKATQTPFLKKIIKLIKNQIDLTSVLKKSKIILHIFLEYNIFTTT